MKRILVLIDFSDMTSAVLKCGGELARSLRARLFLIHVEVHEQPLRDEPPRGSTSRQDLAHEVRHHRRAMEILELELKKEGTDVEVKIVRGMRRRGNPGRKIIDEIKKINPDLIVMGTRQTTKLRRLFLGSVSDFVVARAGCPVMLVPKLMADPARPRRHLVAAKNSPA